jgi:dCTP deaminase
MAVLSDRDIRSLLNWKGNAPRFDTHQAIGIEPCDESQIQPASVDLTLADEWRVYPKTANQQGFDIYETPEQQVIDIDDAKAIETERIVAEAYLLMPHELVLCSTVEYVSIPANVQGQVHGKSSLGRLGLMIHVTAGFIDPGFKGKITLEMYNLNNRPILLHAGKRICQLSLTQLYSWAERPYGHADLGSHYQDQREVTGSRYDG